MEFIDYFAFYWFVIKYLIIFAALIIFLSSIDDFFIDLYYWIRRILRHLTIYQENEPFHVSELYKHEEKALAIMVPAWQETGVVAEMAALAASTFEYYNYHIFIGTYPNDTETQAEVDQVVSRYHNVHKIITKDPGPTSKSDCLNNVAAQIFSFERSHNIHFEAFILHDAEDVIHPLELKLFNYLLQKGNDLIQVPVIPFERKWYQFTAGHYEDEFAEVHGKDMIVRESLLGFVPSAGVGTALSRKAVEYLMEQNHGEVFILGTLTEDYNLGFELFKANMKLIFARVPLQIDVPVKDIFGRMKTKKKEVLIGVREFFPSTFQTAVRQKSRWIIGIVFQGWKSIGWGQKGWAIKYFLFRDRKAIITNLANLLAYFLVFNVLIMMLYAKITEDTWWFPELVPPQSFLWVLLIANAFFLLNRILQRMYFTYLNYGIRGAVLSVPRIVWGNVINIAAMWRAVKQVIGSESSVKNLSWDKTTHDFPVHTTLTKRLGEICLEEKIITPDELQSLLEIQRADAKPLGILLIEKGYIDKNGLTQLLSRQSGLPFIEINKWPINEESLQKADLFMLLEYDLLPLKTNNEKDALISSRRPVDIVIQQCKERLQSNDFDLYIAGEEEIDALQKELLFPDLNKKEFNELKKIIKFKMLPKETIPIILEYKRKQKISLIESCQSFGFLPKDQLKRIHV